MLHNPLLSYNNNNVIDECDNIDECISSELDDCLVGEKDDVDSNDVVVVVVVVVVVDDDDDDVV
jgi:hypothetical protein